MQRKSYIFKFCLMFLGQTSVTSQAYKWPDMAWLKVKGDLGKHFFLTLPFPLYTEQFNFYLKIILKDCTYLWRQRLQPAFITFFVVARPGQAASFRNFKREIFLWNIRSVFIMPRNHYKQPGLVKNIKNKL